VGSRVSLALTANCLPKGTVEASMERGRWSR
jgi:hypothetical protein